VSCEERSNLAVSGLFLNDGVVFLGAISAFHSRFFAPLRSAKRAPFKSGRGDRLFKNSFSNPNLHFYRKTKNYRF